MKVEASLPWARSRGRLVQTHSRNLATQLVRRYLSAMQWGQIALVEGNDVTVFGDPCAAERCHLYVSNPAVFAKVASGGAIGAAEAYMDGDWTTDDLTLFIRVMLKNRQVLNEIQGGLKFFKNLALKAHHFMNRDSIAGSKRNIAAHYDLGNEFFESFLDQTMSYSSGVFRQPGDSMKAASEHKLEILCQKLDLKATDHLIEIGTGWGGLAIYAAQHYGCQVTTTTISDEQYAYAKSRVAALGLEDKITLLTKDYRQLSGTYDKLVSVEMIEAVGLDYLPEFFQQCSRLLKPEGQMVLQAITIADQHYETASRSVDFIQRYIFPGGALPSVTKLSSSASEHSDLRVFGLDDITEHYAKTLRHWSEAFRENLETIKTMDFDDRFIRMWEYYLAYCEGGFTERAIGCVHIQLHKPAFRRLETAR